MTIEGKKKIWGSMQHSEVNVNKINKMAID